MGPCQILRESSVQSTFPRHGLTSCSVVNATSSSVAPTPTQTVFTAPTPTYSPLSNCQNNASYASTYTHGSSNNIAPNAGLNFTVYCNLTSPLSKATSTTLAVAFSYSLSDCIEVCAGYNYYSNSQNCTVAAFSPNATRPANCWVGSFSGLKIDSLKEDDDTDIAVLDDS